MISIWLGGLGYLFSFALATYFKFRMIFYFTGLFILLSSLFDVEQVLMQRKFYRDLLSRLPLDRTQATVLLQDDFKRRRRGRYDNVVAGNGKTDESRQESKGEENKTLHPIGCSVSDSAVCNFDCHGSGNDSEVGLLLPLDQVFCNPNKKKNYTNIVSECYHYHHYHD